MTCLEDVLRASRKAGFAGSGRDVLKSDGVPSRRRGKKFLSLNLLPV